MAADLVIRGEIDAAGVVRGMNSIGSASDKLGAKGANMGRGLLQASYALEDFTFAGIKGVLNNIPQTALALGAGAGLAGAISILAVTASIGARAVDEITDRITGAGKAAARAAAITNSLTSGMESLRESLAKTNRESKFEAFKDAETIIREGISNSIKDASADVEDFISLLSRAQAHTQEMRGMSNEIQSLNSGKKVNTDAEEALKLKEKSKSIDDGIWARTQAIADLQDQAGKAQSAKETLSMRTPVVSEDDIQKLKKAVVIQKAWQAAREAYAEETKKNQNGTLAGVADAAISLLDSKAAKFFLNPVIDPFGKNDAIVQSSKDYQAELEKSVTSAEDQLKKGKQFLFQKEQELATAQEQQKFQKATNDSYDDTIKKAEDAVAVQEKSVAILKEEAEFLKAKIPLQEQLANARKAEEMRQNLQKMQDANRISPDGFLSSSGAMGLSGREAVGALQAINVQKDQLRVLHEIARNTKGGKVALYAD